METDDAHVAGKLDAFLANESARIAAIDADCAGKVSAAQAQAAMQVANLKRKLDETEVGRSGGRETLPPGPTSSSQAQLTALTTFRDEKDAVEGELERLTREATERELAFRKRTELMERQHRTELVKVSDAAIAG